MSVLRVVAAFPGTGKTWAAAHNPEWVDSDSSLYSWTAHGVRNPRWPGNYVEHVQGMLSTGHRVLTSTHAEVRGALENAGIPFRLVYPEVGLRDEYVERLHARGTPTLAELVRDQWAAWVGDCAAQSGCEHVVLGSGRYLSDVL